MLRKVFSLIWLIIIVQGVADGLQQAAPTQAAGSNDPVVLGSKSIPYVQPGCTVMFMPEQWCRTRPSPSVRGCCTPGYACVRDSSSVTGRSCQPAPQKQLQYSYDRQAKGGCSMFLDVGSQCGGTGFECFKLGTCDQFGPWARACCPNGYSCQPSGQDFRLWLCQVNVQDQPAVNRSEELLQYPPRPLPEGSCTCRFTMNKTRVTMNCPSPWSSIAGTSQVPPALRQVPGGVLVQERSGKPVVLRGTNWFGWSVGSFNFDGLWAYCDDNSTSSDPPCQQDGDIPPWQYPSAAIGGPAQDTLGFAFWGKRTMTNDFASVVYRVKLLGFNAIRVQFKFSDLNKDIPQQSSGEPEFFPCMVDSHEYIAAVKTLDPRLIEGLGAAYSLQSLKPYIPKYRGMPHPPPRNGDPACDLPWSAPFLSNYTGGRGKRLRLSTCNYYLPQGPGVQAIYRFVWQVQYLVSQGLYVLLDFSSTKEEEPNLSDTNLLASNWGRLWRVLADIPAYDTLLRGRVFPDLVNEPSRWGCQWSSSCVDSNGTLSCAPILQSYGLAAAAIWQVDPSVPIFVNGLGQDFNAKFRHCGSAFPGMHWGDGFITNRQAVQEWNISTPSDMFTTAFTKWFGPDVRLERGKAQLSRLVLSPHIYPTTVTGAVDEMEAALQTITYRWDQSWGWKMQGIDTTVQGGQIPALPVVIGESGAKDSGDNGVNNTDTTMYLAADRVWLEGVAAYLRALSERTGRQPSWFFWAWNANSGDTKGLVGPRTTWREVQWTKVRMLIRSYGLRPWYCGWWPTFCDTLEW